MGDLTPCDAAWWPDEATPQAKRSGRWALWVTVLVLVVGVCVFVAFLHLAPSVGAAGGCGGG
jgi:uncharacterized membrane protein YhdT